MWFLYSLSGLLAVMIAHCTPVGIPDSPIHGGHSGRHLVTGVAWRDDQGNVPIRHEIRDLKNNFPDQWNLYLLGLRAFHDSDQTSPLSFYQIAGIHGRPYNVWQDAQGLPGKLGGYCPHQNPMFFGWHRMYIALFEQELYKYVRDVALRSPPHLRERFASAADSFRTPYWDWALGDQGGSIPSFFSTPTISVFGPDGLNQTIQNPLYRYDFHPLMQGDFIDQWATQNHTLRWPNNNLSTAESQMEKFSNNFDRSRREFHDTVSDGFALATSLNVFSVKYIENAHGWVHFAIGGGIPDSLYQGHMWPVEYSAFEPIFMLLHSNVDRLFALWQVAHPDQWFVPESVGTHGNFVLKDYQIVDGNTSLSPFWMTSERFWTSNDVRDTTLLGYAYPETQSWKYNSPDAHRAAVNASIAQHYSKSVRDRLTTGIGGQGGDLKHLNTDGSFTDWMINSFAVSSLLSSSFQVRFSLVGDFSSDAVKDVGTWNVLLPSTHGDHQIQKIQWKRDKEIRKLLTGSVSLTAGLLDCVAAGTLGSLEEADVVPFLKTRLTWMVYGSRGLAPDTALQGLTVDVISMKVYIPNETDKPLVYSKDVVKHPEITANKGGSMY